MWHMQVYPTPKIGVLSTGDELVEPTTGCLSRGQVLATPLFSLSLSALSHVQVFDILVQIRVNFD